MTVAKNKALSQGQKSNIYSKNRGINHVGQVSDEGPET